MVVYVQAFYQLLCVKEIWKPKCFQFASSYIKMAYPSTVQCMCVQDLTEIPAIQSTRQIHFYKSGLDSWSPPKIRWDCPMYCWKTKPIVKKQYLRFIFGLGQLCESCPWFPRVNVNLAEECLLWYCKGYDFKFHSNQKFFCDWFSDLPSLVMILKIPLIQSHLYFVKISLTSMPNVMKVDCVWTTFVETPHPSLQTKTQFMVKLFTLKYISA